jgi:hypothetical protein
LNAAVVSLCNGVNVPEERLCGPGVGCADAYRTAEAQQAAQPMDGPARRLAVHTVGSFFSAPLLDGKPALRLVVDNDRSKTAP